VEVPNVVGFSRTTAEDALRDAGLRPVVVDQETDDPAAVDQVLRQDPGPGADVEPRSRVEIVVGIPPDEKNEPGTGVPPPGADEGLLG
jgi:serine/threonine-protein kinase